MNYLIKASYVKDYQIMLTFNDEESGIVDLSEVISKDNRTIFKEICDKKNFAKFKVEADTIVWENGLDLAPEFLYNLLLKQQKNDKK